MAVFARYDELRKEIDLLVAENEELKQLVQLLRENQELKSVLHNQYNESPLPVYESSRIDNNDPLLNQAYLENTWDQPSFLPHPTLRLALRLPPDSPAQAAAALPPPPPPPPGAGAAGRLQPILRTAGQQQQQQQQPQLPQQQQQQQQQQDVCRRNYAQDRQSPVYYRASSTPADDFLTLNYAQPDFLLGSSTAGSSIVSRGYCFEYPIPLHPHLPSNTATGYDFNPVSPQTDATTQGSLSCYPLSTDGSFPGSQQVLDDGSDLPFLAPQPDTTPYSFGPIGNAAAASNQWGALPDFGQNAQFVSLPGFNPASFQGGSGSPALVPYSPSTLPSQSQLSSECSQSGANGQVSSAGTTPAYSVHSAGYWPPPAQTLPRASPPPLPLALQVSPPSSSPVRLDPMLGLGPYFTFFLPFLLPHLFAEFCEGMGLAQAQGQGQAPATEQAQAQAQAPAQPTEAAQQPTDEKPRDRRGMDQNAMSLNSSSKPSKDSKQATMERLIGEIAFQLDRRILSSIFPDRVRLYGFTVSNIPEKIAQGGNDPLSPLTEDQRKTMTDRYNNIMNRLKPMNYNPDIHPGFTEHIVNTYGILRERPDTSGAEGDFYNNLEYLLDVINTIVPSEKQADCIILLNCLHHLSQTDGKPLFIW